MVNLGTVCLSILISISNSGIYTEAIFSPVMDAVACYSQQDVRPEIDVEDYYAQLNYSEVIAEIEGISIDDLEYDDYIDRVDLLVDDLTPRESQFLSRYYVADRFAMSCGVTSIRAIRLARATGKLPSNGVQLLNLYHAYWLTEEGVAEFQTLPPKEQLKQVHLGINPATGSFYTTFSDDKWHSFGIFIEKIEGEAGLKEIPWITTETKVGDSVEMKLYQEWRIVIFGEKPGRILVDDDLWTEVGTSQDIALGGCNCKPNA